MDSGGVNVMDRKLFHRTDNHDSFRISKAEDKSSGKVSGALQLSLESQLEHTIDI